MNLASMLIKSAKPIAEGIAKAKLLTGEVIRDGDKRIAITYMAGVEIMRMEYSE